MIDFDAPVLGVRDNLLLLRSLPAFVPIEDEALALLAEHARVRRVREGTRLLNPAAPIDRVFVVIEGQVRWSRRDGPPNVAGRHQVVGWIALMAREEGIEAKAETDAVVLEVPAETLERALEDHFAITRNTMRLGAEGLVRARGNLPVAKGSVPPAEVGVRRDSPRTLVERVMGMRTAEIFKRASVEAVIALARNWKEVRVGPGEILWRIGEESSHWLLLDYGHVVCTSQEGDSVEVGAGFVLGILDSIARLPRSYQARAATEVVASRVELEGFLGVLETISTWRATSSRTSPRRRSIGVERYERSARPFWSVIEPAACRTHAPACASVRVTLLAIVRATRGVPRYSSVARRLLTEKAAMGRPFLVGGVPRLARAVPVRDWSSVDLEPSLDRLDTVTRHLLAGYWTDVARAKHAAVASYARLAMQLLALGAPPELVAGAHGGMGEELRHARYAFTLASSFRLMPVGPAPLAVDDAFDDAGVESLLCDVVRAGCIATTAASMELRELLEKVEDPALRFVVAEMERDTSEQVTFAWRALQWLCDELGDPARDLVRSEAARIACELAEARSEPPPSPARDEALLRAGYLSAKVRREVRLAALDRVHFGLRAVAQNPSEANDESDRVTVA